MCVKRWKAVLSYFWETTGPFRKMSRQSLDGSDRSSCVTSVPHALANEWTRFFLQHFLLPTMPSRQRGGSRLQMNDQWWCLCHKPYVLPLWVPKNLCRTILFVCAMLQQASITQLLASRAQAGQVPICSNSPHLSYACLSRVLRRHALYLEYQFIMQPGLAIEPPHARAL